MVENTSAAIRARAEAVARIETVLGGERLELGIRDGRVEVDVGDLLAGYDQRALDQILEGIVRAATEVVVSFAELSPEDRRAFVYELDEVVHHPVQFARCELVSDDLCRVFLQVSGSLLEGGSGGCVVPARKVLRHNFESLVGGSQDGHGVGAVEDVLRVGQDQDPSDSGSRSLAVTNIINAFGGTSAFARAIGTGQSTVSEMKRRGSIPAEYWVFLVRAADDVGIANVTYENLARIHAVAKGKLPDREPERATP